MPGYLRPDNGGFLEDQSFDPVGKLRTSTAQALIDTDFEYGMQISKWENLGLLNNRPFAYPSSNVIPNITSITIFENQLTVTVTTSEPHGLLVGTPVNVQDTFLSISNGNFIIEQVPTATTFTYTARAINVSSTTIEIYDPNKTALYVGTIYTKAEIGGALTLASAGRAVTVTTSVPHGLSLGNEIAISGITASTNAPNGSFDVARIVNSTQFVYYANNVPTGTLVGTNARVYVRPQAQFLHRPFDGGVVFSANTLSNNQQAIRQTRRYFRYQSGKGMQISSGTVLKPNLAIESMTASAGIITVQTKDQHNLQPGTSIEIFGADEVEYNGAYSIIQVIGYNTFKVEAATTPIAPKASGNYYLTVSSWFGCSNRIGMFDSQNGVFFEFDGQDLYLVRRSSTYQISGKVTVTSGSNTVIETDASFPTNFSKQLNPGDFVVIRGQSYRVESISNDKTMTISPSYRGATALYSLIAKTVDTKIPQSQWNLDTMDGNGPSGYNLDLTKMQMFYIDYSWYGAGYIRWSLRGVDGEITPIHKLENNNTNSEAYMRSGNLPGRYETSTFPVTTTITQNILVTDTTLKVKSTKSFANSGTLLIRSGTVYEYVNYNGKTETEFLNVTREKTGVTIDVDITAGNNVGTVSETAGIQIGQRVVHPNFSKGTYVAEINGNQIKFSTAPNISDPKTVAFSPMSSGQARAFTFLSTSPVSIEPAFPTFSAAISHWGTSVIMDGRFDDDKSLIFNFGQTESTTVPKRSEVTQTGSGVIGENKIVVNSNTGIVSGMQIVLDDDFDFAKPDTIVVDINGTDIILSQALIGSFSEKDVKFSGGNSKALFSIRVAPSVDNGISANFGQRELINRMQLSLKSLGVITSSVESNLLVTAILNGIPSSSIPWTNIVKNSNISTNSSLSQIADYSDVQNTIILGGEITGGFYVQGTSSIDLEDVRDLGNSILGGGQTEASSNVYPDGPDVLSIVVTNLSEVDVEVLGRLSWAEAQA
jgi:hypothetical protein